MFRALICGALVLGFVAGGCARYASVGTDSVGPGYATGGGEWNSQTNMPLGEWTHAAITYNGRAVNFYINGQKDEREVDIDLVLGANDNPAIRHDILDFCVRELVNNR